MSSPAPSVPSCTPTPPSPRDDNVATWTTYKGRQQEYKHCCDAQTLRSNEVSVPETGLVLAAAAPLAPGQFTLVPKDAHVSMEDAYTEAVTKALRRPRGSPTHEWCLANSPAVVAGLGSEEAELRRERDRGLVQIRAQAEELTRARRERDEAVLVRDQLLRKRVRHPGQRKALEGEVGGLLTWLVWAAGLEGMAGVTVPSAVEVDELARRLREAHKLEDRRREWLLWEVASVQGEALDWAWEHHLLLDGLLSGVSYVVEEASLAELPPNLVQGVARLGRLMSVHRHRNLLDPGSWLKVFVDGLEDQPSIEEIMQIIWNAMAVEFGPGGNGPQEPAGEAQGPVGKARGPAGKAQGPAGGTA
ncbi:hypothetical protein C0992_004815 [Termitomyces sp. T32_za158]|nr:hypothetical protein C0992_004815 [Termitomyces sp. T32_za158]